MGDVLEKVSGFIYAVIFIASFGFIFIGIRLIYLGVSGGEYIDLAGLQIPFTVGGKISIGLGALGLILVVRMVMYSMRDLFPTHGDPRAD